MNRQELRKAFDEKLIDEAKYKEELFKLETNNSKVKKVQRHYEHITEDEFEKIIRNIKSRRVLVACYLAYGSGLRISEIISLSKDDIELKTRKIKVRQGKESKDRYSLLGKHFKKDYIELIPVNLTKSAIEKSFHIASLQAGINKVIYEFKTKQGKTRKKYRLHFHCLRHSFGINLIKKGVPANVVQSLLGHANLSTTSTYLHLSGEGSIAEAIAKGA